MVKNSILERSNLAFAIFLLFIASSSFSAVSQSIYIKTREATNLANKFMTAKNWENHSIRKEKNESSHLGYGSFFYIFELSPRGFIIIPKSKRNPEIIGYSPEHNLSFKDGIPTFLEELLNSYIKDQEDDNLGIHSSWGNGVIKYKSDNNIAPMVKAHWNQGCYYNTLCPPMENCACGHAPVGCVAVATGQLMHYWRHPQKGHGYHEYSCEPWGTLSSNFSEHYYHWDQMPLSLEEENTEVARFLSDAGIGCEMHYGLDGNCESGSHRAGANIGLSLFFNYRIQLPLMFNEHSHETIIDTLYKELENNRPILAGGDGHAFLIDGYQSQEFFHLNLGWGGNADGYYRILGENAIYDLVSYYIIGIEPNEQGEINCQISSEKANCKGGDYKLFLSNSTGGIMHWKSSLQEHIDWCRITSDDQGDCWDRSIYTKIDTLIISFDENPLETERSVELKIQTDFVSDSVRTITIVQEKSAPKILIDPKYKIVNSHLGYTNCKIINGGCGTLNWESKIIAGKEWLKIISDSSGTEDYILRFKYSANTAIDSRIAEILVSSQNDLVEPDTIVIEQKGIELPDLCFGETYISKTNISAPNERIQIDLEIENIGDISSSSLEIGAFLSNDSLSDNYSYTFDPIDCNAVYLSQTRRLSLELLFTQEIIDMVANGNQYIILKIDHNNQIQEKDETNNTTSFQIQESTRFEKQEINKTITIFPNPANDWLFFKSDRTINNIVIRNSSGHIYRKLSNIQSTNSNINLSYLNPGVYFIEFMDHSGNKTIKRFLKIH